MNITRKVATAFTGVALAVSGIILTAPTAHADVNSCLSYLESMGYPFTTDHFYGCYHAEKDWMLCYDILREANVHYGVAARACDYGAM
ncbi:hypothetical protein ABT382_26450 [Streptomyces pharetrae]|uniref:hypothetical protein n=1 Tax=Streptomyces pharetrae TaxID=291370 RepID=UPI0033619B14